MWDGMWVVAMKNLRFPSKCGSIKEKLDLNTGSVADSAQIKQQFVEVRDQRNH